MKKIMHFLFLSCQKATELIEKKLFVGLTRREKAQLFMHTSMCDACKKYSHQSEELDHLLKNHITNFVPDTNKNKSTKNPDLKGVIIKSLEK